MKKSYKVIVLAFLCLVVGMGLGYAKGFYDEQKILSDKISIIHPIRLNDHSYSFINPLLMYLIPQADQQTVVASLKNKIIQLIAQDKAKGVEYVSVYFSDLNRGKWFGVNENDQYDPASIMKVAIMVAYFKKSESNPKLLDDQLTYTGEINSLVGINTSNMASELRIGKSYKVDDLIDAMIINSDNGATLLLLNNMNPSDIDSIFTSLNLANPNGSSGSYTISPRQYSFFYRVLYSSTYLTEKKSEKALKILSGAKFKDGLVAGVPEDIVVSHKYGQRITSDNQVELHDCGIVYYPNNPYLLCVMTKGDSAETLKKTIQDISGAIYQEYSHF